METTGAPNHDHQRPSAAGGDGYGSLAPAREISSTSSSSSYSLNGRLGNSDRSREMEGPVAASSSSAAEGDETTPLLTRGVGRRQEEPSPPGAAVDSGGGSRWAKRRAVASVVVLTLINLLNYMDRYTVAGVLSDVQDFYDINDSKSGLVQSSFIVSYMFCSMGFGYLGDRFNRKLIMAAGIMFWSGVTLASSFVGPSYFGVFLLMRALVGVGEASYSTIAPTIIADLFKDNARTFAMSVFYFAIPAGSGLGYIVGSSVARHLGNWQWALRITPAFGFVSVFLVLLLVKDPPRGESEGGTHLRVTSWFDDLKYLFKHKSFLLSSAGFTCVAFVTGALALWAPKYVYEAALYNNPDADNTKISLIFGAVTCVAGFAGVAAGSWIASRLRTVTGEADPLVCAVGMLIGCPFLAVGLSIARLNETATWFCVFIAETCISFNWALVTDILMYIVIPTRRSSAEAVQMLMCHALGDAISPFLVGKISDEVQKAGYDEYYSLQYALYMTCFACAVGGGFFLFTALFIRKDRRTTDLIIAGTVDVLSNDAATDAEPTQRRPNHDTAAELIT